MINWVNKILHYQEYTLILFFFVVEQFISSRHKLSARVSHLFNNILFEILVVVINLFIGAFFVFSIRQISNFHLGLFNWFRPEPYLKIIMGVFFLDLGAFAFHWCTHNVPFLWRFHKVHHSDHALDSSTVFRGHPIEGIFVTCSRIITATVLGLDIVTFRYFFYLFVPIAVISHVNIKFPSWLDRTLGLILVTPNFHKVHHDDDQTFTDSNYGECFIIWDKLFNTFKVKPFQDIKFGLKEFNDNKKQSFWYLLKSPFVKNNNIESH